MENHNSTGKLIAYSIIVFVLLLSLIQIFINSSGAFFQLELLGFIILLAFATFGLLNYNTRNGETVLFFFFLLYLGNLALLWYFKGDLYFVLLLITLLGGILSVPQKTYHDSESMEESFIEEPHSVVFDAPQSGSQTVAEGSILLNAERTTNIVAEASQPDPIKTVKSTKARASKTTKKPSTKKATAKHSPGKYVASSSSNQYHEPKCEWAKKINPKRRLWFTEKEQAWEKGYKAHKCVN